MKIESGNEQRDQVQKELLETTDNGIPASVKRDKIAAEIKGLCQRIIESLINKYPGSTYGNRFEKELEKMTSILELPLHVYHGFDYAKLLVISTPGESIYIRYGEGEEVQFMEPNDIYWISSKEEAQEWLNSTRNRLNTMLEGLPQTL